MFSLLPAFILRFKKKPLTVVLISGRWPGLFWLRGYLLGFLILSALLILIPPARRRRRSLNPIKAGSFQCARPLAAERSLAHWKELGRVL